MTHQRLEVNLEEANINNIVSGLQIVEKIMGINDAEPEEFDATKTRLALKDLFRRINHTKIFVEDLSEELARRVRLVEETNALLFDATCDFTKLADELEDVLFGLTPEKVRKLQEQDHSEFVGMCDDDKECA